MARFLVSLNTGVVLPWCEASLKSPGVRELSSEEAAAYLASVEQKKVEPMDLTPEPAEPIIDVPPPKPEKVEVVTQDFSEGEPDIDEVLGALEVD